MLTIFSALKKLVFITALLGGVSLFGQQFTQTIRGTVVDGEDHNPIPGVTIQLFDVQSDSLIGSCLTDDKGNFLKEEVAVGMLRLRLSAAFYSPLILEDIHLTSSKEVVLDLQMTHAAVELSKVEVSSKTMRGEPVNRMSISSAVTITPEMTEKIAGSWDDPMRVVTTYPGIVQQNSGFNYFTVRGNSPLGMLYRLEGIPIHNPNHFSFIGSNGGFVTQFSSSLLSNSDFFSSVFPAEFGNATAAVFDFRFRRGNNKRREHTFKASFFGLDLATEGPFSKNSKASYVMNYRYSTLGLLALMIDVGGLQPAYQDFSFNVHVPTKKGGSFRVFGVGGLSSFLLAATTDSSKWSEESSRRTQRTFGSNSGVGGIAFYQPVGKRGYLHAAAAASAGHYFDRSDFLEDDLSWDRREFSEYNSWRATATVDYNLKFNKRHSNKTGFIYNYVDHNYQKEQFSTNINALQILNSTKGGASYLQAFSQSVISLNDKLDLNAGVHLLYFALNNKLGVDPRVGLSYQPNSSSTIAVGYGHHSRIEDPTFYFIQDSLGNYLNQNIGLLKAHHTTLRYAKMITKSLKLTTEVYFQYLYDVPAEVNGTYSVQNLFLELPQGQLYNVGEGKNYGVEVSLQQFTLKGFYYMISGTIFESLYKSGDGVWRNTEFNQRFSYNVVGGKEFKLKPKENKQRSIGLNFNFKHSGGTWRTPVDLVSSIDYGWTQFDHSNPFSQKQPNLYNLDFTFSYSSSRKKISQRLAFNIKNMVSNRAILREEYDEDTQSIKQIKDYGVIPVLSYSIHF